MADANPLNKALPAEVVLRRRPQAKRQVDSKRDDEVEVDLKAALALKPEARSKWLAKALDMAKDGRASSRELFDIISSRKFTAGLSHRIGRRMCVMAHDNSTLFSEKQQRYMQSDEWILNTKYPPGENEERDDRGDADDRRSPSVDVRSRSRDRDDGKSKRHEGRSRNGEDSERDRRSSEKATDRKQSAEEVELERRAALERRLAQQEKERRMKREQKKKLVTDEDEDFTTRLLDKLPQKKQKGDDEADAMDNLLDKLTQRQQPVEEPDPRSRQRRRNSRSRSVEHRRGGRRRADSRSRSISIQASREDSRERGGGGGGSVSFEDALRKRMAERNRELDSSRIPVTWTRDDMRSGRHLQISSRRGSNGRRS